jgi:predicted Zn-dependent peptidase
MAGVYVGTQPARAEKAADAIRGEFARMAREGLRGAALDDAKQQTLGQLMLSLESPTARMYRLASTAVYSEPYRSLDEVLGTVESLTADEMSALATEFFDPDRQTVVTLGPNGGEP